MISLTMSYSANHKTQSFQTEVLHWQTCIRVIPIKALSTGTQTTPSPHVLTLTVTMTNQRSKMKAPDTCTNKPSLSQDMCYKQAEVTRFLWITITVVVCSNCSQQDTHIPKCTPDSSLKWHIQGCGHSCTFSAVCDQMAMECTMLVYIIVLYNTNC